MDASELTWADHLLEEGIQRGREEGRLEGRLEGLRDAVRQTALVRFGAIPPALNAKLVTMTDEAELIALMIRASTAATLSDLP